MKRTLGVNLWRKVTAVDGQHSWNMTLCIKQVCVWNVKENVLQHVHVRLHLRWGLRLMHAHVSYTHTNTREHRCLKLQAACAPFPSYAARLSAVQASCNEAALGLLKLKQLALLITMN